MRAVTKMQLSSVFAFSDGQGGSDQTLAFMRKSFIEVQQRVLPYKVAISVSALTVLISYLMMISRDWFRTVTNHRILVMCVWESVFLAALTRPGMQGKMLSQVGLLGLRDPFGQIISLFR
jgi:hypothetical protein